MTLYKYIIIYVYTALLVVSCSDSQDDDLTHFMNDQSRLAGVKIEPLPQVQAFVPKQYNADGLLHDPFAPRKAVTQSAHQPDLKRPREPLEAFPLESLKFVGVLTKQNKMIATIQTPDNMVYQVKPGNYMGEKLGLITALSENKQTSKYELAVQETIQDPVSGEWSVQMTKLELQETQK